MPAVHYNSYTDARAHFKDLLDAAERGMVATVRRDSGRAAVVDAERLRHYLALLCPRAEAVAEDGGWSLFLPGLPIAADGETLDAAVDDMISALREYAEDWHDHLSTAPNHRDNWGLVQLVGISDDIQLHTWLVGSEQPASSARA
ncbi:MULTISPECIES: prevent-host-death protein [unclassified Streptomyces]|uniref:prevent-host-death protein n=1 Tax=unclassified Streptomyces TaxID=2593676 RepID=UPI00116394F6|nr:MULTISPECIES: prevent-host-death protein [unclassified Streptomyces]NMI54267.1 prevent-host-death protein [Streptomyces sp. RLA2-12]QDN63138.1 prevent-host-death protein [Streptomyces sp. S1D4-20]QDN73190.1 prevent-host-death protein [Streptomyces sp. S1D4-14]QDO55788.1 prevent-host-death protein [Streptomyces sp. RLB3-5]QDO56942.1 prevent-host-death protein [Streptomyces sp. RLB1-8]